MTPSLGTLPIDLPKLMETRMLLQAASGGGKSWALRRLIEQTASSAQQIIIDPEGEFASLREKFDFIIAAPHDGDAVANPATAAALARALWESGTSAVVDIYDMKAHDRVLFVRRFCEALIAAPKSIWHPTMLFIDEIQLFAPEGTRAESTPAVIDIASRGRKRGLCLIGATLRLAKVDKNVASELGNKLIGRTGLDIDVARAADDLGMSKADAKAALRGLEPGQFYAYGPALCTAVERTKIGPVQTSHPTTGGRIMTAPPPPSKAILAKLSKIEGLQRTAEDEVKSVAELTAAVTDLRRKLAAAENEKLLAGAGVPEAEVQRRVRNALAAAPAPVDVAARRALQQIAKLAAPFADQVVMSGETPKINVAALPRPTRATAAPAATVSGLRAGAVRILQELAARHPAGYSRPQVGTLTQFAHKGGTFTTYIGDLRRGGFVEERSGLMYATEAGIHALGDRVPAKPTSHAEAMALWRKALRAGAFAMLEAIVAAGARGITRQEVADVVGMTAAGGTFTTYLGDLRRNGLITDQDKRCTANDILFPKGQP